MCRIVLASVVIAAVLAPSARADTKLLPAPGGEIYHAAYTEFHGSEDHVQARFVRGFERLAGKPVAWAYFSNNWTQGISFPSAAVQRIRAAGSVPFIRLMARSSFREGHADPRYSLQSIIDGAYDPELRAWGAAAAAVPYPLLVEFGTEVNGDWFPWNGRWNGGGATTGYGDPALPDGPERFRDAYRHIHDVISSQGADNLTWFFHVDDSSQPAGAWNRFEQYYPGDAYVDWLGVSVYGSLTPQERWSRSFASMLDRVYPRLVALAPSKPIAVLEWGAREDPRKADWISAALRQVASGRWPALRALSYWHERWRNGPHSVSNLHIDSDRASLRAYRRGIASPRFTGTAVFSAP